MITAPVSRFFFAAHDRSPEFTQSTPPLQPLHPSDPGQNGIFFSLILFSCCILATSSPDLPIKRVKMTASEKLGRDKEEKGRG